MLDPDWHNHTPRLLALFPEKGEYTLQVIAERDGEYALTFYPLGWLQVRHPGSPPRFSAGAGPVPIKIGEIHTYVFPGEFDRVNPYLSPNRFYLKRVK